MSATNARTKHKNDADDRAKHITQDEELCLSAAVVFAAKCAVGTPDWLGVVRRCGFSHHLRSLPRGMRGRFGWPPLHDLMQGVVRPSHVVRDGIF